MGGKAARGRYRKSVLEEILDCDIRLKFALTPRDEAPAPGAVPSPRTPASLAYPAPPAPSDAAPAGDIGSGGGGDLFGAGAPLRAASSGGVAVHEAAPDAPPAPALPDAMPPRQLPASAPPMRPQARTSGGRGSSGPNPANTAQTGENNGTRWEAASGSGSSAGGGASNLNARYTFDNFVVGQSNRLAQAGAQAVAQSPGTVYNPLFLYGPPGLGKTHLMHAIGNEIIKTQTGGSGTGRVAFVSGEAFTTHFIASLRNGKAEDFRRKWRSVDLWLVDDIQFYRGQRIHPKRSFSTPSTPCTKPENKSLSRRTGRRVNCGRWTNACARALNAGLSPILPPRILETRLAILHKKALSEHARIPDDVLMYMAKLVQSNIRTLEGALVKLIAYASLVNSPVTTELAHSVLERYYIAHGAGEAHEAAGSGGDDAASPLAHMAASLGMNLSVGGRGEITAELVQNVVAKQFGIKPGDLAGKKRDANTTAARQIAMHLLREMGEWSLPNIGQAFGGRTHVGVLYGCDKIKAQAEEDAALQKLINELTTQIRAQAPG